MTVNGLDEILAEFHSEGRPATGETAAALIERLEAARNHVPRSGVARREYAHVLLEAYKEFVESRGTRTHAEIPGGSGETGVE